MYQRSTFGRCLLGLAVFALCTSAPSALTRKPTVQAPAFIAEVM
jgi:hypothetical protein